MNNQSEPACNKIVRNIYFIREELNVLVQLSNAAFTMGFDNLSSSIDSSINNINGKLSSIEKHAKEDFDNQFKTAQENSANIVKAALAGMELNNNE